ncbi:hypothetical protein ACX3O0_08910 [Homoserinimonas sp. A447]
MKTTFDLPESLVRAVKKIARDRGTTARAIVQQALTRVVEEQHNVTPFQLADASTAGWQSMNPEVRNTSLHDLVLRSYDERP